MNSRLRKFTLAAALVSMGTLGAAALAQGGPGAGPGYGGGPGYGPGMMGGGPGYGPGMMGGGPGYGPGRGYGPGGGGYGPGYGPRGGGYGPGAGCGAGGPLGALKLTDSQLEKIQAIQEENRQKSWAVMGQMRTEMFKLRRLYYADSADTNAVVDQQKKVDELRRQMLKLRLESRKQVEAILTPEQREQFRQYRPWWMAGSEQ